VLLIDPADRVLLFRSQERPDGHAHWYPVGGEVEAGESFETAAVRETLEETGLDDVTLEAEVLARRFVFPWRETVWDAQERWWLAHVEPFDPVFAGMEELESGEFSDCAWMSVADLASVEAAGDVLTPANLLSLLPAWLAGEIPAEPIQAGE
jgi:8-oxo-dGTP pyrophosphatase MutT (NUDIX family)